MDGKTPWDKLSSEIYRLQFSNFHCFQQESVSHFKVQLLLNVFVFVF